MVMTETLCLGVYAADMHKSVWRAQLGLFSRELAGGYWTYAPREASVDGIPIRMWESIGKHSQGRRLVATSRGYVGLAP